MSGRRASGGDYQSGSNRNFNNNNNNKNGSIRGYGSGPKLIYSNGYNVVDNGGESSLSIAGTELRHHPDNNNDIQQSDAAIDPSSSSTSGNRTLKSATIGGHGDFTTLRTLLRPFQNVSEKKCWPNNFKELTKFFQTASNNFAQKERAFDETIRALEKVFLNKLYKNTAEELVQCMTVFCAYLGSLQHEFFVSIFRIYFNPATSEENRSILLRSLMSIMESTTVPDESCSFVQRKLKKALETINNAETLLQISQLMVVVGRRLPRSLQPHIKDLIDFLLGSYMEGVQPAMVRQPIEEVILALYLKNHTQFAQLLLETFIEDFEKYFLVLNNGDMPEIQDRNKINLHLHRMTLRVRIFAIFYRKIYVENGKGMKTMDTFCWHSLGIIIKGVLALSTMYKTAAFYKELTIECNEAVVALMETLQTMQNFIHYANLQNYCNVLFDLLVQNDSCQRLAISSLDILNLYVKKVNTSLTLEFIDRLFDVPVQNIKFCLNQYVQKSFIALFYSLLKIKDVGILDRSYKNILKSLKTSFEFLQKCKNGTEILKLDEDMFELTSVSLAMENEEKCRISLYIDLTLLAEIANTKHSLIAMLALSPNFVELMLYHLDVASPWFAQHYPAIHYSILYLFSSHCNKHHNFIAQSAMFGTGTYGGAGGVTNQQQQQPAIGPLFDLSPDPIGTGSNSTNTNPVSPAGPIRFTTGSLQASNYFIDLLKRIHSILSIDKLTIDSIVLCLKWVRQIMEQCLSPVVMNRPEFVQLMETISEYSFSNNKDICRTACDIIKKLLPMIDSGAGDLMASYHPILRNFRKAGEFNVAHTRPEINELFLDLMAIMPAKSMHTSSTFVDQTYNVQNKIFLYPEEAHLAIVGVMNKQPAEQFSALAFQSIMEFIQSGNPGSLDWLGRLFHSSVDQDRLKIANSIRPSISYLPLISNNFDTSKVFQNNYWPLIFWACYEFVQYCIENRLKTPLGKPQDTFQKIESLIKMFVNDVRFRPGNVWNHDGGKHYAIRIHMLLMIVDNFDKLIYNSVHGNSLRLYGSSKASKSFFKKNKATCSEWITRNRRSIMILAARVSQHAMVIWHGQELLRRYQMDRSSRPIVELEFILLLMMDSLIELKAAETIMGYHIWFDIKFNWFRAAFEEAQCHYERALDQYQAFLKERFESNTESDSATNNKTGDNFVQNFCRKRIVNCLINLERYQSIPEWIGPATATHSPSNIFGIYIDHSYLETLTKFGDELDQLVLADQAKKVPSQPFFDLKSNWHIMQSQMMDAASKFYHANHHKDDGGYIKKISDELNDLIQTKMNPLITSFYTCGIDGEAHFLDLQKTAYRLRSMVLNGETISSNIGRSGRLDHLIQSLHWERIFDKLSKKAKEDSVLKNSSLDQLILQTATVARKNLNLDLSRRLLAQYVGDISGQIVDPEKFSRSDLLASFETGQTKTLSGNLVDFYVAAAEFLNDSGGLESAVDVLSKTINHTLDKSLVQEANCSENSSRMFLKLVKFINQQNQPSNGSIKSEEFFKLHQNEKLSRIDLKFSCIKNLEPVDNISGKLLLAAVNQCPGMANAWYQLADWSYRWGRKLSDADGDQQQQETNNKQQIEPVANEENVIQFYKLAANSYIRFLHVSSSHDNGCDEIDATLRLLRLVLKHAPELREVLESGLQETPTKPWKNITLQLFSRLNHHEPYVRQSISELLCRIGADSPHLVIFPAVTGLLDDQTLKTSKNFDYTSTKADEDDDEDIQQDLDQSLVRNCYAALLETLSQRDPNLISQAKLFVHELRRITVLWDELWIGTLQHSLNEVKKQVVALEREIERTKKNQNLYENEKLLFIKEQHNIFFRRILYSLKLTHMLTSDTPETPHEEWFQKTFNPIINVLIDAIQNPENIYEPSNILYQYQNLFQLIRKRYQFQMQDISPNLARLENTVIPLPGVNGSNVTLKGVFKTVSVLHTYTKPKKIIFIGSDGRNYTYLFKGHEDLHLDERIMQLLSIVNKMIAKYDRSTDGNQRLMMRARHYSVTPMGNKSGLIQWVQGGQALSNLYKRWLANREVSLEDLNKKTNANEIFKSKLQEKGITTENRSDWNIETLKTVYEELVSETPNDLILRELWCSSLNAYDHWNLTQNFIASNAIMDIIGYVLGLGDRHLDNILLDLTTGEVIHIDYNICFEKGKTLRVPEMVLCRLTPNIVNAFGITGLEGSFRISCENILKILRKGKETLLTLLEAFVYDPLVDWTPEHEEGFTGAIYGGAKIAKLAAEGKIIPRKQMEKENQEAIERLKLLMRSVERRNANWPKIETAGTPPDLSSGNIEKIVFTDKPPTTAGTTVNVSATRRNKRNAYAFSVWKRIKMKLDGRDPDPNKRSTVFEQVSHVFKESVSVENLSRMYEGWTSWV